MLTKSSTGKKGSRLSREIAGMILISVAVALFLFLFLEVVSNSIALNYIDGKGIDITEDTMWYLQVWITGISFGASVIVFSALFMFQLGQKFQYLKKIIEGVDALREHGMDYEMPLEGNNELTELASAINYLSQTERVLKQKEEKMAEERERFIRAMSHDIRTPLTSIISYSEMAVEQPDMTADEVKRYADMVQKKATQIRDLAGKLLQGAEHDLVEINHGRLLMQQLAEEWLFELEDDFDCRLDYKDCPDFAGRVNVGDIQRIFDNLSSNIKKYADSGMPVDLRIFEEDHVLIIWQGNTINRAATPAESYGIGLESIRRIAENCGGSVCVEKASGRFSIKICLSLEFFRIS